MRSIKIISAWICVCSFTLLASCATHHPSPSKPLAPDALTPQAITPAAWQQVEGWQDDSLIGVTSALRSNCLRMQALAKWKPICTAAAQLNDTDTVGIRAFFERYFTPFQLSNSNGSVQGLITGYYEPLLHGSRTPRAPYLHPLYRWPASYKLGQKLPERAQLLKSGLLKGSELVYVDNPIDAFFLQIQGSGRILLDDGSVMRVGYNGTNGQPYQSIGRWLIDQGKLTPSQTTMQGLKEWARTHPTQVESVLAVNPRFVFFKEVLATGSGTIDQNTGPAGALGVPLTPERSIAVDPTSIPLGMPVFLATTRPLKSEPLNRLVFAQDVGTAIKGKVRADYFWGLGDQAGELAGKMKQSGRMWLLIPKP